MKKVLHLLKHNTLFGFVVGIILSSIAVVIAESIQSNDVLYDNSITTSNIVTVKDALDNIYNITDTIGSGFALIANDTGGISSELVANLYRYQGVHNEYEDINNYICFGTTNKNNCINNIDAYMYRIIGVDTNGKMKLLKHTSLEAHAWDSTGGVTWPDSELFLDLNGSYFLTNTTYVPSGWEARIVSVNWKYGDITSTNNVTAEDMVELEDSFPGSVEAKIGLLHLQDFYYALPGGNNCSASGVPNTCKTCWLYIDADEWVIPRRNSTSALYIYTGLPWNYRPGSTYNFRGEMTNLKSVRPVFFLRASERIASGSGTITDPYILN